MASKNEVLPHPFSPISKVNRDPSSMVEELLDLKFSRLTVFNFTTL
jgi:hypothetical protein